MKISDQSVAAYLELVLSEIRRTTSWPAWLFAGLLAFSQMAGSHIVFVGGPELLSLGPNYFTAWSNVDILTALVEVPLYAVLLVAIANLSGETTSIGERCSADEPRNPWSFLGGRIAILLLAWLPYMLGYFPGGVAKDSLVALAQGPGTWDSAYPLGFTLLIKAFFSIGVALGSPNLGIFISTLFHSVAMAAVVSYGLLILARRGANSAWLWAAVVYFALAPAFPIFAITMLKDVPFSLAIVGLTYFMLAVVESEGSLLSELRGVLLLSALAIACIAFRNNGIYVIALTIAVLLGVYRLRAVRAAMVVSALLLAVVLLQGPGYRALGISTDRAAAESLGVPLQGIGSVVAQGKPIAPEDQTFLNSVLPLGMWRDLYVSANVDPIKSSESFNKEFLNSHSAEFITRWARVALRYPGTMFEAYALGTFGYWKIGHDHPYLGPYLAPNEELGLYQVDLVAMFTGHWISPTLTSIWAGTPGRGGGFPGEALFTWMMFAVLSILALQRRWRSMLILMPCLAVWVTIMIAAPVAYGLRFLLPLALCAPGLLLLPFYRVGMCEAVPVPFRLRRDLEECPEVDSA